MTNARAEMPLGPARRVSWLYANANEGGFYHVLHDDDTLAALRARLFEALTPVERLGLVAHQWAAVRGGHATIESFLDLAGGFGDETDFDVLDALTGSLRFIDSQLVDAVDGRREFQHWLVRTYEPAWHQLGWEPAARESDDVRLRRASLLRLLGDLAEAPSIAAAVRDRFAAYIADRHSIDPNLADALVGIAARDADAMRYEQFLIAARGAHTPQERRRFQYALADFRDAGAVKRTLTLVLTDDVPTQDVGIMLVRLLGNRAAREETWAFIKDCWADISKRLPPMMVSRVIEATSSLQTPAYKRDVAAFFRAHPVPTARRALKLALERFDLNEELRRRVSKPLEAWLAQHA
jgi:puromycin-sensitive aminopeptidase